MANVSSSNSLEKYPKLRFPNFTEPWTQINLGDIATEVRRVNSESNAPIMMLSAGNGFIMQSEKYSRDNAGQSLKKYILLRKGELAYNHGASKSKQYGCCYELLENEARIPYVYHCFAIKDTVHTPFIAELLNNSKLDRQLKRLVSSSVRMDGLLNISFEDYMSVNLAIPEYNEQKQIADFLKLLENKIVLQKQLVDLLKKYKRGVIDGLFSQNNAFYLHVPWKEIRIADLFDQISDKGYTELPVLTIVQGIGTRYRDNVDRRISYDKTTINAYKRVLENDFILHLRSFEGGLEIANGEGVVSPAYTILRAKTTVVPLFYYSYFRSYWFINNKLRISVEGIRDGKSINMDTFWNIKIPFPPIEEQIKIASFIKPLNEMISKAEAELKAISLCKTGLLQQLFI